MYRGRRASRGREQKGSAGRGNVDDARRRAGALSEWQGRQIPQQAQTQRQELRKEEAASGMTEGTETSLLNFTAQHIGRVPFQSDDTSDDDSTSAAPDDTSEEDSTSAAADDTSDDDSTTVAPDDTSDDDSTSAAPPLPGARGGWSGRRAPRCVGLFSDVWTFWGAGLSAWCAHSQSCCAQPTTDHFRWSSAPTTRPGQCRAAGLSAQQLLVLTGAVTT
jgi:hypothetical protein